jgi:hypothetical protein
LAQSFILSVRILYHTLRYLEVTMDPARLYIMEDMQTRAQTLMELQDLWSHGLQVLTTKGWHSDKEKQQAQYLAIALELLQQVLECEYSPKNYAIIINTLPKDPKEIPDEKNHLPEPFTTHRDTV